MSILKVQKLNKSFGGVVAASDLNLSFEKGKINCLVGPNGSGKSTLINMISGIVAFDSGFIIIGENTKLNAIKPYELLDYKITRTFQEVRLFNQMTVLDNILLSVTERQVFSAIFEKHKEYHLEKAREILEKVNLWEKRGELAMNLSYGQRKLLEIARSLAMDAEIYLFDEPFAGLFPEIIKVVKNILKELKDKGKTIVLVEHDMDIIRSIGDSVIVMDAGELLAKGEIEKVFKEKEVIEAYLGK